MVLEMAASKAVIYEVVLKKTISDQSMQAAFSLFINEY